MTIKPISVEFERAISAALPFSTKIRSPLDVLYFSKRILKIRNNDECVMILIFCLSGTGVLESRE